MPQKLWAKSVSKKSKKPPPTILKHCRDVRQAAESIWEAVEPELAEALAIARDEFRHLLLHLLRVAALLHDLGKANSAFQDILRPHRPNGTRQPVRHEILSAMLLAKRSLLTGLGTLELWALVWAVAGHHLKMLSSAEGKNLYNIAKVPEKVTLYLSDEQVCILNDEAAHILKSEGLPVRAQKAAGHLDFDPRDDGEGSLEQWVDDFACESEKAWKPYEKDVFFQRRLALLKALLMAADAAGSALHAQDKPLKVWIGEALKVRIDKEVLEPVVLAGHHGKPLRFQKLVGRSKHPATVVVAGCGNGKTTAAYMWGQKWAVNRKLFFTYPTTGTASAGYEDYLLEQKKVTSALIHSRAPVDIQAMLGSREDNQKEEKLRLLDDCLRWESLQSWDRQVVVCTVDTVLGLIQNQRRPLYAFPAIAAGAFVFDEIHSYDKRLFGELLTFLQTFPGAPVLLMSASIPPHRMQALKDVLGNRMGEVVRGDKRLEGFKRYCLKRRESEEACWPDVEAALRAGKKVLWVCNTVNSAIDIARKARQKNLGVDPIIYHARFRYRDKVKRQQDLIAEFAYHDETGKRHLRMKPGRSLAITTQVCEMSLDISADIMVTAECPLPSLVQRLGRLNRYAQADDPWPCLVYPFRGEPYNEEEKHVHIRGDYRVSMTATRRTVDEIQDQPCSQADLAKRLNGMVDREDLDRSSAWLQGGWESRPEPARESDTSITIIREEELSEIERELGPESRQKWTNKKLVPWTIPMLHDRRFNIGQRKGGYPLAPTGTVGYESKEGAAWKLD
jgi:CRISPR-associated endonuclease/helicase Cas3